MVEVAARMGGVRTETRDRILVVTIDRPHVRNAVDGPTATALNKAFRRFDADDVHDVAVLTGAGGVFCAGADLSMVAEGEDSPRALHIGEDGDAPLGLARLHISKPVIAAVEGYAVAGGLELALWCDLRVAAVDAVFGVFCRRWGVPLMDGGTIALPRLVGHSHALDMILTGRGVSGGEARMMGLVNRIVAKGEALNAAIALADDLCKLPQVCMRSDRRSAYEQWGLSIDDALLNETRRGMDVLASGETREGARRFAAGEGRHGQFPR